jgi:hypothetical protein
VIHDYRGDLDRQVIPTLGDRRLSDMVSDANAR